MKGVEGVRDKPDYRRLPSCGECREVLLRIWHVSRTALCGCTLAVLCTACGSESPSPIVGAWRGTCRLPSELRPSASTIVLPPLSELQLKLGADHTVDFHSWKGRWESQEGKIRVTFEGQPLILKILNSQDRTIPESLMELQVLDEGNTLYWSAGPGDGTKGIRFTRQARAGSDG